MRHLGVEVDALMIAELVELYPAMMAVATGAATLLEIEGFRPRA